tara:strand:+ start:805 stop:978 length:174 start_codon:yes stop_codon:yes gene_type:complete
MSTIERLAEMYSNTAKKRPLLAILVDHQILFLVIVVIGVFKVNSVYKGYFVGVPYIL